MVSNPFLRATVLGVTVMLITVITGCPGPTTTTTSSTTSTTMRTEATVPEAPPPSELQNLKNPLGVTPANIQAGKQLYDRSCWVCHGLNGKGDGPAAPSLPQMPIDFTSDHDFQTETDGQVFWLTFNGIKGTDMPGFKDTFSNDEIWQIESYIIQFRSNPANRRGFGQSGTTRFTGTTSAGGTTSTSMAGTTSSS